MAKGAIAKQEVLEKILSTFEGSFLYNEGKEIRIPIMEDGNLVQIKVSLTCAKTNVIEGEDITVPGTATQELNFGEATEEINKKVAEPTEEEKQNVQNLLQKLGF